MVDSEPPQINPGVRENKPYISTFVDAKEKISAYLSYQSLKIKEYFGKLNEDEFHKLLSIDFQDELRDNPPIKEVFSAEFDLKRIKYLPREQKREAINSYKDNLARQRIALAACRVFIERSIEFNHDVSIDKLAAIVDKFSEHYSFDPKQIETAQKLIELYYLNRNKVLEVRKKYPDNYELIKELSGVNISKDQKLDVSIGPMSIDIGTNGFNAGRLFERSNNPVTDFQYAGFASESNTPDQIYFIVINKDKLVRVKSLDLTGKYTSAHEYEHQKNKLFRVVFNSNDIKLPLNDYNDQEDPIIKKAMLEFFLISHRTAAFDRVKDEITSSLYDRPLLILQHSLSEMFFKQSNSPYDYLSYVRNWEPYKEDSLYQETVQRVLIQEYKQIIERSVASFSQLVYIGKYTTQEAIALLTDKPLEQWPKTVKRLLEQKEVS